MLRTRTWTWDLGLVGFDLRLSCLDLGLELLFEVKP